MKKLLLITLMATSGIIQAADPLYSCEAQEVANTTKGTSKYLSERHRYHAYFQIGEKAANLYYIDRGDVITIKYRFVERKRNKNDVMVTSYINKAGNYLFITDSFPKGEVMVTGVTNKTDYTYTKFGDCTLWNPNSK